MDRPSAQGCQKLERGVEYSELIGNRLPSLNGPAYWRIVEKEVQEGLIQLREWRKKEKGNATLWGVRIIRLLLEDL